MHINFPWTSSGIVIQYYVPNMGDILHTKSCRMNVETFSSIQTIKYALRNRNVSAAELYGRKNAQNDPVDRVLTHKIRTAAGQYKKVQELKVTEKRNKMAKYTPQSKNTDKSRV